jgi:hypothetical protein
MATPDVLGARVDHMRIAVEAIRETSVEGQHLYEEEALLELEQEELRSRG